MLSFEKTVSNIRSVNIYRRAFCVNGPPLRSVHLQSNCITLQSRRLYLPRNRFTARALHGETQSVSSQGNPCTSHAVYQSHENLNLFAPSSSLNMNGNVKECHYSRRQQMAFSVVHMLLLSQSLAAKANASEPQGKTDDHKVQSLSPEGQLLGGDEDAPTHLPSQHHASGPSATAAHANTQRVSRESRRQRGNKTGESEVKPTQRCKVRPGGCMTTSTWLAAN